MQADAEGLPSSGLQLLILVAHGRSLINNLMGFFDFLLNYYIITVPYANFRRERAAVEMFWVNRKKTLNSFGTRITLNEKGLGHLGRMNSLPTVRKLKGFTMIELMLVSAIIGLLASIAIPKFANLIDKSRESALKGSLGILRSALEIYYADNEGFYPKFGWTGTTQLWGIWTLNGKYIDMDRIKFVLPRYAANICPSWPNSYSATDLFSPTGTPGGMFSNLKGGPPDPPSSVFHWVGPYFSYFVWCPSFFAPGSSAHLGTGGACPGGNLIDLSGRPWSHW